MKKFLFTIIILMSFSFPQDILIDNKGVEHSIKLIEMGDSYFVIERNGSRIRIRYEMVKKVILENGNVVFQNGNIYLQTDESDENNFGSSTIIKSSVYLNDSDTSIDLSVIGSVMLVVSGVMGLVNTNRECNDCSMEDWEDFGDSMKLISNIQYSTLIIGGILMAVDHSNKKIVQQE